MTALLEYELAEFQLARQNLNWAVQIEYDLIYVKITKQNVKIGQN